MVDLMVTKANHGALFSLDYFNNQVPWFGPFVADKQHYIVASSILKDWPTSEDCQVTCWIFNEAGDIVGEKLLLSRQQAGRPVTIYLREEFPELSDVKGMVALLVHPIDENVKVPTSEQTWNVRIFNGSNLSEVIATGSSQSMNFPEKSGRRSKFRLFSSALTTAGGWRPIANVMNASANPEYATTIKLRIAIFSEKGERLDASPITLPPFGTAWIDILKLFGDAPSKLLSDSGRGSYIIESDDAACIGYHFLYHSETGKFAGDHTRPLLAYLPNCYGAGVFTINRPKPVDFLKHARMVYSQSMLGLRGKSGRIIRTIIARRP